jgi:hypothetical protein
MIRPLPPHFKMPKRPSFVTVKDRRDHAPIQAIKAPDVLAVDKATECHVTPPDVAARMAGYCRIGDILTLEPSAGTGNLVRALLAAGHSRFELCIVERHVSLCRSLYGLAAGQPWNRCFLEYAEEARGKIEFPQVIMNPPFSAVKAHIRAAVSLMGRGGHQEPARLVALVPITFEAAGFETLETLPDDTFSTAKVRTKIVRYIKPD